MKKLFIIKVWVLFGLLLSLNHISFAQDAGAMLKFENAEKAYNAGDYPKVLQALEEVEELVGVTSKTLYLRIVSQNELLDGGNNLYDGPEQFQLLSGLREHVTTYMDAMGSQGLDDKYRMVYRIQEALAAFPTTEQEWQAAYEREEAKKITKEYHANGKLKSVGKMEDGKKTGEWKHYYENGELESTGSYKNDHQYGLWNSYYESGELFSVFRYNEKGNPDGGFEKFYEDGQLKEKGTYNGGWGSFIGENKSYHANGQLASVGDFGGGYNKVGIWKYYHDNGQVEKVERYPKPGRLDGEVKAYYKNGKLKSIAQYDNDDRVLFREYYESGQLSLTVLPEDDGYWKYYYENGQLKEVGKYKFIYDKHKNEEWKSYHENGQLAKIANYIYDNLDGRWETYYSNGQLKEKGKYDDGVRDGKWEAYYENGQLQEEGQYELYIKGKDTYGADITGSYKVSKWTYYHPNGQVQAKGKYNDGKRRGKWRYYDEQGNRLK